MKSGHKYRLLRRKLIAGRRFYGTFMHLCALVVIDTDHLLFPCIVEQFLGIVPLLYLGYGVFGTFVPFEFNDNRGKISTREWDEDKVSEAFPCRILPMEDVIPMGEEERFPEGL